MRELPGRAAFGLITTRFRVTVTPRCSPRFTVVLVHGWYMDVLLDITTLGGHGRRFGSCRGQARSPDRTVVRTSRRVGDAGTTVGFSTTGDRRAGAGTVTWRSVMARTSSISRSMSSSGRSLAAGSAIENPSATNAGTNIGRTSPGKVRVTHCTSRTGEVTMTEAVDDRCRRQGRSPL